MATGTEGDSNPYTPDAPIQQGVEMARPQTTSAGTMTVQAPVKRLTEDRAVAGPAIEVPSNAIVEISPLDNNAATAYFSTVTPEAAKSGGPRTPVTTTGVPRRVKVRNLSDIFVYSGTIGEGLLLSILLDTGA